MHNSKVLIKLTTLKGKTFIHQKKLSLEAKPQIGKDICNNRINRDHYPNVKYFYHQFQKDTLGER